MMRYLAILTWLAITSGTAAAQAVFPPDPLWVAFPCTGNVMTDRLGDDPAFLGELDIVGDIRAPAAFHSSDVDFLYLRIRLDEDPAPAGIPAPFSWGFEFDLDGNLATYEVLVLVDGVADSVVLFDNTATTLANDPADPADLPPIATYPFAAAARSIDVDDDFFLDIAVPWEDLRTLGLDHTTRVSVWVGSSDLADGLDGDLACHDGGTGVPTLDGTASGETAGDPAIDSDGDGFTDAEEIEAGSDPDDANSIPLIRLEGGGGCDAGGGATLACALALLGLRRNRRRARSG
jgi:hypothetical protein